MRLALMLSGGVYTAEDLVQSALTRAYRHRDRVLAAERPEAYLRRMVLNEFLSWRRLFSSRETPTPLVADAPGADDPGERHAQRDAAWRLLAWLPRQQRAVLVLRYYEDLTDDDIATLLGCSPGTVRSNASRALAALRAGSRRGDSAMNETDDRAGRLLRETFADAERLLGDDRGPAAVRSPGFRRTPILLAAAAVLAIVAGSLYAAGRNSSSEPRPAASATATTSTVLPSETGQIYGAVVAGVSTLDKPAKGWPMLFILDAPYPDAGAALGGKAPRGQPFDPAVRDEVERAVRHIAPVVWVSDRQDAVVTKDGCAMTRNNGSLIKLGPIKRVDGHVEVGVHSFQACLGAHWLTYRLDAGGAGWRITGTVGPQAIS